MLASYVNEDFQVQNGILHSEVATFQEDPNHGTNYPSRRPEGHKPGSIMEDGWASQQTWVTTPYNRRLMGYLDRISRSSLHGINVLNIFHIWVVHGSFAWCRSSLQPSSGETREAVPLCELRAPRSDVVEGRFMEAEVSPRDWRECEVLEAAGATLCHRSGGCGIQQNFSLGIPGTSGYMILAAH